MLAVYFCFKCYISILKQLKVLNQVSYQYVINMIHMYDSYQRLYIVFVRIKNMSYKSRIHITVKIYFQLADI